MPVKKRSKFKGGSKSKKARIGGIGLRIHMKGASKEKKMARRGRVKEVETPECLLGHSLDVVSLYIDGKGRGKAVWWCSVCQEEFKWTSKAQARK